MEKVWYHIHRLLRYHVQLSAPLEVCKRYSHNLGLMLTPSHGTGQAGTERQHHETGILQGPSGQGPRDNKEDGTSDNSADMSWGKNCEDRPLSLIYEHTANPISVTAQQDNHTRKHANANTNAKHY